MRKAFRRSTRLLLRTKTKLSNTRSLRRGSSSNMKIITWLSIATVNPSSSYKISSSSSNRRWWTTILWTTLRWMSLWCTLVHPPLWAKVSFSSWVALLWGITWTIPAINSLISISSSNSSLINLTTEMIAAVLLMGSNSSRLLSASTSLPSFGTKATMNGTLSCSPVNRSRVSRSRVNRSQVINKAWAINRPASHSNHLHTSRKSSSRMIKRETGYSTAHHYRGTNGLMQTKKRTRLTPGSEVLLH